MSRLGKCQNHSGCLLAYRGEEVSVPDGQPFVCAECGKSLAEVKKSPTKLIGAIVGGVVVVGLLGGAVLAWPMVKDMLAKKEHHQEATPTPEPGPQGDKPEPPPVKPANSQGEAEPPPVVTKVEKVNLNVDPKVKEEVLKRIDLMPTTTVSSANKDKLYTAVERTRKMGLVVTVPFPKGKAALGPAETEALKTELDKPDIVALRNDPTAVFVILGYADPKGDPKQNLVYSQQRADVVVNSVKAAGVINLVHAVAMGGSTLLDDKNLEKNRIAEVWIVLP